MTIDEYFGEDTSVVYPSDIFFQTNAPGPNPFVYLFDVSAGPNSYQYALYRDVGTGHSFSTTGTITITGIETVSAPTPEPSTLGLVGTGFAVILTTLRRRFT